MSAQNKKRVVVLEDQEIRIDWLKKYFGPHIDLAWSKTVPDFLEQIETPYDVAILDHDLGAKITGTEAAAAMTSEKPVIVWSVNPTGAGRIQSILQQKNIPVQWVPFTSEGLVLVDALISVLK